MRVSSVVPGAAAACAAALAGCGGSGDVRTVTVTTAAAATTTGAVEPATTTTSAAPTTTASSRPAATTTTRRARTATAPPATPDRPAPAGGPPPPPTTTRAAQVAADPVGGTTVVVGRAAGTGYSVRVPVGWNDGARRLSGSGVDVDRTYVKGRGDRVTSNILIMRLVDRRFEGRSVTALRPVVRQRVQDAAGGARVVAGPPRTVDGEPALTFLARRRIGDVTIVQQHVAAIRDGALYVVGLNATRATYPDDARVFLGFLRSWRWR
jgi:hypothetical protein